MRQATDRLSPTLESGVRADQLWRMVDTLPRAQADLIRRAFVSGETHQQIAQQTGLPLGTVKSRIRLGLGKRDPWEAEETRERSSVEIVRRNLGKGTQESGEATH